MSCKHYREEYREQIVKLARTGRSVASLAREFEPTIRNWIAAANGTVPSEDVELRRELRQVKRKRAMLEEEKAILATAAAWFTKETIKTPTGLRVHKDASGRISHFRHVLCVSP